MESVKVMLMVVERVGVPVQLKTTEKLAGLVALESWRQEPSVEVAETERMSEPPAGS